MQLSVNRFKRALKDGRQQWGIWHTFGGPDMAELLAASGYDWVLIDGEHGAFEVGDVRPSCRPWRAIRTVLPWCGSAN